MHCQIKSAFDYSGLVSGTVINIKKYVVLFNSCVSGTRETAEDLNLIRHVEKTNVWRLELIMSLAKTKSGEDRSYERPGRGRGAWVISTKKKKRKFYC